MHTSPVWGSPKYDICFSWSHLDEIELYVAGIFALGRCRGRRTSRQNRRSERRICPLLSWPFAAGPASSLFVVGCRRERSCDTYQVPRHSYQLLDHAVRFFFFFSPLFWAGSSKQILGKYSRIVCCCLLLLYFYQGCG